MKKIILVGCLVLFAAAQSHAAERCMTLTADQEIQLQRGAKYFKVTPLVFVKTAIKEKLNDTDISVEHNPLEGFTISQKIKAFDNESTVKAFIDSL